MKVNHPILRFFTLLLSVGVASFAVHSPALSAEASTASVASSGSAKFAASTAFEAGDAPCSGFVQDREGFIWLGTRSKGLLRFDGQKLSYLQSGATGIPGKSVCQLFQDSEGQIWIGTEAGLAVLDKRSNTLSEVKSATQDASAKNTLQFGAGPSTIVEDRLGRIWFGTAAGLSVYDKKTQSLKHFSNDPQVTTSIASNQVRSLAMDLGRNVLWLAYADKGVDRFDIAKEEATHFRANPKNPQALSTDAIEALAIDKKGNLWLTASSGQLIRLDADKKIFSTYSRSDAGLPDFAVAQWRLLSNGTLLAQHGASATGLFFFNPALGRGVTVAGAQGSHAVFEDRDGRVWTAGANGMVMVTTLNAGSLNRQLVPVYLRAVRQNGQAMDLGRNPELTRDLRLNSADKSFEFEFSALTYQNAHNNRYAYRLVGYETEWQDAQNNQIGRYTNLPPGDYELQIKAANSAGLWSDPTMVLKVTLVPAWWQTSLFYGLLVAIAALVLYALYALTVGRLRRQMASMQALVEVRTTELREQRQKADEAALSKSYFLSNISHEIRTPMNAIMGFANLMSRTKLDNRQRDYLTKISLSGRNLLGILNNIIDFSKTELGKLTVERTSFVLNVIVQNVIDIAAEKAGEKDIEVICRISPDVPFQLVGDPLRLGQILSNYLDNAVKFTERGEISVSVTMARDEQASWTSGDVLLRFEVRDTGIGLSEDQRHQLFQSFSQLDQSATRKYGGTGMGLVVCKTLAALMGGDVGVQSTPGKGSMFWFTARLGWGSEHSAAVSHAIDAKSYRVLVVDDNKTAAQVLTETISEMGFPVESCNSGQAALNALMQASRDGKGFDLLLLDWQMPQMDGLQTAKRMAALNLPKPPHTIMVTAYSREDVIDEARACGINEVLRKPVNPSTLMATMVEVLAGGDFPQGDVGVQDNEESYAIPADVLALGGARILLVEDNQLNQEVACELLREAGFTVDVADNGMIGLEKLQAMSYDLVFMDMQMPVMDGVTATQEIRRNPAYASLPVVAMTASAMQADRERCIEAGMNDYVVKPIDPADLWTALLRWLKPAGQR